MFQFSNISSVGGLREEGEGEGEGEGRRDKENSISMKP